MKTRLQAMLLAGSIPMAMPGMAMAEPGAEALVVPMAGKPSGTAVIWLESSLKRVFPRSSAGSTNLSLLVARKSRAAFQVCVRNQRLQALNVQCHVASGKDIKASVRVVGLVPMPHLTVGTAADEREGADSLPGLVPDPLYPTDTLSLGPDESRSFWVTLEVPAEAAPGPAELRVELTGFGGKTKVQLPVKVEVSPLVVQARKDFPVTHWWRGEATWDYYKTGMFDEEWWRITRAQMEDMLAHGSDVVYVPAFFNRRETFKRPCQLLIVSETQPGKYQFNWSRVKRFTDMCREIGFREFEWPHLWIYWGVKNPMRIYTEKNGEQVMLWPPDISGFSDTYLNFLKQYLPELQAFLTREELMEGSYFHLSDEPGGSAIPDYKHARQILRELAPWMKVMDALSDIRYGREGLTDMPIPVVSSAKAYVDEKIPHWVYFCCSPKGPWLNRFMDTPLPKIRMAGWLFYRFHAKGLLHWGFNYWHKLEREEISDPFNDGSNADWPAIPFGDGLMIYPGKDGQPLDSIRWEVFAESLQDYAILQTAGIKPEAAMLLALKGYDDFPKNEQWIRQTLEQILKNGGRQPSPNARP